MYEGAQPTFAPAVAGSFAACLAFLLGCVVDLLCEGQLLSDCPLTDLLSGFPSGEALLSAALESRGAERDAFEAHRQGQGASAASGAQAGGAEGDGDGEAVEAANAQNAAESLRKVTAGLRGFVQQQSTFEGAEVKARGAEADDDGVSDDDSDGGADGGGGAEGAGAFLDPEKFLRELQAALGAASRTLSPAAPCVR